MSDWLFYIFGGSFFFAMTDVINDINIKNMIHEGEQNNRRRVRTTDDEHPEQRQKVINDTDIEISREHQEINANQDVFIASCFSVIEIFAFYFIKFELMIFDVTSKDHSKHIPDLPVCIMGINK
jgi:hypothetical protein